MIPFHSWEASLTGDLVCGHCSHVLAVFGNDMPAPGLITCPKCKKMPGLSAQIVALANARAMVAYPKGRPFVEERRWKGDDLE